MIDFKSFQKPVNNKINAQELRNKVLMFVRQQGPLLPVTISQGLSLNTIMVGAMLSELIAHKLVKITSCKIGSSPLYYVPGQENKLTKIRDYLSQKPKQIFDILKENKILRDSELEPWQRVAVREIKDFAHQLDVTIEESTEVFWKWYMLNDEETNKLISKHLNPKEQVEEIKEEVKEEIKEIVKEEVKEERIEPPKQEIVKEEPKEIKKPKQTTLTKEIKIVESPLRTKALNLFSQSNIELLEELVSKKTECSFKIKFNSLIGSLTFLAIAKKKAKLNEDDVHIAHSMGIHEKLPVLLLAKDIAKKAQQTLEDKGIVFKKI